MNSCEAAKIELSDKLSTVLRLNNVEPGIHLEIEITRAKLEELAVLIFSKVQAPVD